VANDVSSNPWILDTAGTVPVLGKSNINVEHFELVGYAADTDTCQIKNGAGKIIWEANGAADLSEVRSGKIGWIQGGLFLSQVTAGKVRVYIK
jgi:hypothetical protein